MEFIVKSSYSELKKCKHLKNISLFCKNCTKFICQECKEKFHLKHNSEEIQNYINKVRIKLQTILKNRELFENLEKSKANIIYNLDEILEKIISNIRNQFEQLKINIFKEVEKQQIFKCLDIEFQNNLIIKNIKESIEFLISNENLNNYNTILEKLGKIKSIDIEKIEENFAILNEKCEKLNMIIIEKIENLINLNKIPKINFLEEKKYEKEKIEIDVKQLPKKLIDRLELDYEGNFEIENSYNLPKKIIEQCFYNFPKIKKKIYNQKYFKNIILILIHFKIVNENEIKDIIELFIKIVADIKYNPRLNQIFEIKNKIEAFNNPLFSCEKGYLISLQIAFEKGIKIDNNAINIAAKYGNIECLDFLNKNGFCWYNTTVDFAATAGQLETLKFLVENGCQWNSKAINLAEKNKHFECSIFLKQYVGSYDVPLQKIIRKLKKKTFDCLKN